MFRTGTCASQVLRTAGSPAWYYAYLSNFLMAFRATRVQLVLGHLWSLAVEEHFYLLFPLLVYRLSQRRLAYALAGMIVTAILVRIGLFIVFPPKWMAPYTIAPARTPWLSGASAPSWLARAMPIGCAPGARPCSSSQPGVSWVGDGDRHELR